MPRYLRGVRTHENQGIPLARRQCAKISLSTPTRRVDVAPRSRNLNVAAVPAPPPPPKPIRVKPATAEVFSTLFDKAEARGSVPWVNFEAALAELGFSVIPKFGSVFTFFPPDDMSIQKPITLHRPHKSRIEGHLLLIFARRLNRLYGWKQETFQIA
ncbi:hypothetical protein NUW58_g7610 [Xylaria curta]|uniref:Uncharacterized protein n=1 Tax=Xylaria curta TaxID=42375 RepID=A0ACC1NIA5_9PEZI|nr:hypothetical protein NUW58_g7610 [Xylaria curta]